MTTIQPYITDPGALNFRTFAAERGLPMPVRMCISTRYGDSAGCYDLIAYNTPLEPNYTELTTYMRKLQDALTALGFVAYVTECTDQHKIVHYDLRKLPGMSYVAQKPCGCIVDTVIDLPDKAVQVAATVEAWIAKGYVVGYMTHDEVARGLMGELCSHSGTAA